MSAEKHLCEVCYRPSPDIVCSRRCQGLKKLKQNLDKAEARRLLLIELRKVDRESSICPGRLSKIVMDQLATGIEEERDALSILRETLFALRQEGSIRFFQKNILVSLGKGPMELKGPFRVKAK